MRNINQLSRLIICYGILVVLLCTSCASQPKVLGRTMQEWKIEMMRPDWPAKKEAILALANFGEEGFQALTERFQTATDLERIMIIEQVSTVSPIGRKIIAHGLHDPYTRVRYAAFVALTKIAQPDDPLLLEVTKNDKWILRLAAEVHLGNQNSPSPSTLPVILDGLRDKNALVRMAAFMVLVKNDDYLKIGKEEIIKMKGALCSAAKETHYSEAFEAIWNLRIEFDTGVCIGNGDESVRSPFRPLEREARSLLNDFAPSAGMVAKWNEHGLPEVLGMSWLDLYGIWPLGHFEDKGNIYIARVWDKRLYNKLFYGQVDPTEEALQKPTGVNFGESLDCVDKSTFTVIWAPEAGNRRENRILNAQNSIIPTEVVDLDGDGKNEIISDEIIYIPFRGYALCGSIKICRISLKQEDKNSPVKTIASFDAYDTVSEGACENFTQKPETQGKVYGSALFFDNLDPESDHEKEIVQLLLDLRFVKQDSEGVPKYRDGNLSFTIKKYFPIPPLKDWYFPLSATR